MKGRRGEVERRGEKERVEGERREAEGRKGRERMKVGGKESGMEKKKKRKMLCYFLNELGVR